MTAAADEHVFAHHAHQIKHTSPGWSAACSVAAAGQGPAQGFAEADFQPLLDAAHRAAGPGQSFLVVSDDLDAHVSARDRLELLEARDSLTVSRLPAPMRLKLDPVEPVHVHT